MIFFDRKSAPLGGQSVAGVGLADGGRGPALTVLALVLGVWAVILMVFRRQVAMVLDAWDTMPSHEHGYVVLLVVAYLLWTKREQLRGVPCEPSIRGFAALAVTGFVAMLGELVSIAAVVQFSIILMMISAVWAVTGERVLRAIAGPLAFLFFAVPFGQEILPVLMTWTADATVVALRHSGVPVYQEGRNFVIPSGKWSVVEACGGIRYLMTSVFIGAVFAYVTYTRVYKRALFMLWAIVMPLVANWVRAYAIVMVAHLTANEWGLGLSHIALGWVIFGVAIFSSFAVGVRWHDPVPAVAPAQPQPVPLARVLLAGVLAAGIPLGGHWLAQVLGTSSATRAPELRMEALATLKPDPHLTAERVRPNFPGARSRFQATYAYQGQAVDVFVAYYRNQTQGMELINVVNALEPTKDWSWAISSHGWEGAPALPAVSFDGYVKDDIHAAVYHFYWVNGTTTTSAVVSKLLEAVSRLRGRGDDAAMVAITAYSRDGMDDARRRAQAFASDHLAGMLADLEHTAMAERE